MKQDEPISKNDNAATADSNAAEATAHGELQVTVIQPRAKWRMIDFAELWRYRGLLYFLTWRDVKIRYKQTMLGFLWAIIRPLMYVVVFTILFGHIGKVETSVPYPIFSLTGVLAWQFFADAIGRAGNSVVGAQDLITKVYFPRLAIPFASVGAAVFDFFISLILLFFAMLYYHWFPPIGKDVVMFSWSLILLLPLLILVKFAALGVGTLLAALNVAYRDFKHTIPFLIQIAMFATPTIFWDTMDTQPKSTKSDSAAVSAVASGIVANSGSGEAKTAVTTEGVQGRGETKGDASKDEDAVLGRLKVLLNLNPMTGLIASFRAAALGWQIPWFWLGYSTVTVLLLLAVGCLYFNRVENSFADII